MRKILSLFSILLVNLGFAQSIKPYLQAKTENSIYVNWISDAPGTPSIEVGSSATNLNSTVTGTQSQFIDGVNSYYYNTVQLVNLTANTKYFYRAFDGASSSDTLSFKTSPLPGQAATADGHLKFLIMGDNQIQSSGRYDTLVAQARRKVLEKWGGDPADNIELTFMVGDQVDLGNLDQYRNIHFAYNEALSGEIPIQTTVGNHETYGSLGMSAYYSHFYLDQMAYQGITSGTENYYAYQVGNVLFVSFSSEHTGNSQYNWLDQVLTAAATDNTVDWILSFSHRPYEAEQYVGDISGWVKNTAVPRCMQNSKYLMHVGAHHHIYSRGQFKDGPVYNIISGGTAWDQYWGQSAEQDFDYIQKTISNWCYQIVDVDVTNGKVDVETYSIGSPIMYANNQWKNNELVDEFHRYLNQPAPNQPSITNNFGDSLELPYTLVSSPYTTSGTELLNTTQFEVSQVNDFSIIEFEELRDFENLYGQAPGQNADSTQDINAGVNILELEIPNNSISNGWHYVRVRHRDRNLEWSPWSEIDSFKVFNSYISGPHLAMDSNEYHMGSPMVATYSNGPANSTDWVGIYPIEHTPGPNPSTAWQYCNGATGTINFSGTALSNSNLYYAAFFELNGYNEVAPRDTFYYGNIPVISSDTTEYPVGQDVLLNVSNAPAQIDTIEIMKVGHTHGVQTAYFKTPVNASIENFTVSNLPKGYYAARYYFKGLENIGETYYFSVGDTITSLWIDQPVYDLGEDIIATWTDAPGIVKDWLGIYNDGDDPNVDPLIMYAYFDGEAAGTKTITDTLLPTQTGDYFIVMFTDDSYTEVSNREYFTIVDPFLGVEEIDNGIQVYPNPVKDQNLTVFSSDYPIESITLRDFTGRVVYRTNNVKGQKYSMLSEQLPSGTYMIEIQTRKLYRYKIVVQ
ncbi:Por secretion system C-terminal sorting domain-containing protein [Lishizhenia tianjinensis]|uniref:Por secretion system C-terminal sorting domain-containing protein n=1 Tax=Lishizhenia tianjinensis TaxID=477690 RepID=A0A1I6XH40_9FLAO|nr:fibronectin type III domain-containing protein [Lishizhenia tianjinensis]SFT37639.1 Por secretion system C-terminal sorting domain-containing protein [Lishizhenia tianjinensis]